MVSSDAGTGAVGLCVSVASSSAASQKSSSTPSPLLCALGVIYAESAVVADVVLSGKAATPAKILAAVTHAAAELQK